MVGATTSSRRPGTQRTAAPSRAPIRAAWLHRQQPVATRSSGVKSSPWQYRVLARSIPPASHVIHVEQVDPPPRYGELTDAEWGRFPFASGDVEWNRPHSASHL